MNTLDVNLRLDNLHCFDEGDGPGSAEPYLWTVFFKIDGDATVVNPSLKLQGTAAVVGTPGNHGNLPNHDVDRGESVPMPAALGEFRTQLKPIPLQQPVGDTREVGGVMGVITVLMEEDNTPNAAIAKGHVALNKAVQDSLNALIPTLEFGHSEPTPAEIEAMKKKIGDKVAKAVSDDVSVWEWLGGSGNMDDKIGSEVFPFSHNQLEAFGVSGIGIKKRFRNQGDWELNGVVKALPVNATTGRLRVAVSGIPGTLSSFPVRVAGPGFSRALNKSTTLEGLLGGIYTITARGFTTGQGRPTCRKYTPTTATRQTAVTAGQTASTSVGYTSEACGA
jgi:hypothetical protein